MANDLPETWAELGFAPADNGCTVCRKTVNDDGTLVMWRCAGCNRLVCRECTLCTPGWRKPSEPHGPSGWDDKPSAGGRMYMDDTLCSTRCWERLGEPEE